MTRTLAVGVLACLNLMLASIVHAQTMTAAAASPGSASGGTQSCGEATGPTSCGAGGPASKSDKSVDEGGGNPINVITGNKYQREVDLPALPGVLGLELVRHYNSQFSGIGFPNGIMGRGWKLSYETELHLVGRALQIVQADGARLIFNRDLLDPSHCGTSRASDGRIAIRRGPRGDEYVWTWPNGRRLSFDNRGKLVQIAVPTGEFATLQHDARGHLVQVTDPQGRQLKLNYAESTRGKDQPARFTGVQSIDTPVGRFAYEYGSAPPKGTQVDKIQLVANLVKVHLPTHHEADKPAHPLTSRGTTTSSVSRAYHYEDARFPTLLTGISVSGSGSDGKPLNQRISTYGYDQRAWAVSSEHGGLKVELAVLERASLSELPGSTPGRSVLVHGRTAAQPEGRRLEIRSAMVAGDYRITETRGEPCVAALPCPRANMRYGYDAKGRLIDEIQLDPQGRPMLGVRTAYDPLDRVVRVSQVSYKEGKRGAERWMVRYEYGAASEQPTLIAKPSVVAGREHQVRVSYNDQGQTVKITETAWRPAFSGQPAESITRTVQHTYQQINGRSVLASTDGPLPGTEDTTRYQWDARGNFVQALSHPMGLTEAYRRDDTGRIIVQTPPDKVDIASTHLPTGEPSSWRRGPAMARVQYDALQRPTRIELPDGEVQQLAYTDQVGRAMASNAGWARWLALPAALDPKAFEPDLPTALREAPSHPNEQPPNEAPNQPWQGAQAWVDDFGRLAAVYTAVTGWETRRYDEAGRLIERRLVDSTVWRWKRDALGRIQSHEVSRPGATTKRTLLRYEGVHLVLIEHPQQSEHYAYDAMGRVQTHTVIRAGLAYTERYEYDQANRLTTWRLPEGGSLRYSWGVARQLKAIEQDDGRASAVLGERLSAWLGLGRHRIIAPLPSEEDAKSVVASTATRGASSPQGEGPELPQQALQAERGYRWGNGVQLHWRLDARGQLAGMHYVALPEQAAWHERLMAWLPSVQAAEFNAARSLIDLGYHYDDWGRMNERRDGHTRTGYAYDSAGRLIVADQIEPKGDVKDVEYYAYGADGQLLGSQVQGRSTDWRATRIERDPSGLPSLIDDDGIDNTQRLLLYSADRRLIEVSERHAGHPGERLLARYSHDTHGHRIEKTLADGRLTAYLWNQGQLVAETMAAQKVPANRLARRYVYAQGVPVAVIDYDNGRPLQGDEQAEHSPLQQALAWMHGVWQWVSNTPPRLTYVHANEIGTPIAATDANGQIVWRIRHSSYGLAMDISTPPAKHSYAFQLNLRMPGQYFDQETNWHDNGLRTYDPQRGEYLEPDPLGPLPNWRSGQLLTQPFAYANHNPLIYADPLGLILFAFDGTGNSKTPAEGDDYSNIFKMWDSYNSGVAFYITGIGTTDDKMPYKGNMATGDGFEQRLKLGFDFLDAYVKTAKEDVIDIDIIGFSRGAAEARVWANQLIAKLNLKNQYAANAVTKCVNLRFMGLFDTVPHLGAFHGDESKYDLTVGTKFKRTVHAVAMNEHRGGAVDFDGRSIFNLPSESSDGKRVERGFIGSHADIGGGYGTGDLSDVTLMWMIKEATEAGAKFSTTKIADGGWNIVTNPILHDKSYNFANPKKIPLSTDRAFVYGNGKEVKQIQVTTTGLTTMKARSFVNYSDTWCGAAGNSQVGTVNMADYIKWLKGPPLGFEIAYHGGAKPCP